MSYSRSRSFRASRASRSELVETLEARLLFTASLDIMGVQPDAFSQPQIHALVRTTATGQPLIASDGSGGTSFDIVGFLDTGTSEVLLSQETAQALQINPATYNGQTINFGDVGVQGTEEFNVSNPLYVSLAPYMPTADVDNINTFQSVYNQTFGPMRLELNPNAADPLVGPLDIFGMPAMQGKVVVVDPTPPSSSTNFDDVHSWLYDPGTPFNADTSTTDPGIPTTNYHLALTMVDLSGFTQVAPTGAPGPAQSPNPFIGPNPLHALDPSIPAGTAPPITIAQGNYSATGSFLFDTGATDSFISQNLAAQVHVHYKAGTYGTDNPVLVDDSGTPIPNQFVRQIGGVGSGGILNAAGFFLSSMSLPTTEGQDIRFVGAPVLVVDVSTTDATTGKTLTLDGDFGMNYLTASANIDGSAASAGAFDWLVFDQPDGLLGLDVPGQTPPASVTSAVVNGDNPHGLYTAAGQTANGVQRSMVDDIVYTFSSPVTLGAGAFSIAVHSGLSGTVPNLSWAPVGGGSGPATQWVVTFSGSSVVGNSIANGVYDITLSAGAYASGSPARIDTFYRLFGDCNGDGFVNNADSARFRAALTNYNVIFDYNDDGSVNNLDSAHFRASLTTSSLGSYTPTI